MSVVGNVGSDLEQKGQQDVCASSETTDCSIRVGTLDLHGGNRKRREASSGRKYGRVSGQALARRGTHWRLQVAWVKARQTVLLRRREYENPQLG